MQTFQQKIELIRVKTEIIDKFIDPIWAKEFVDGRFIMRVINDSYGTVFPSPKGTTVDEYRDNPDTVYWSKEEADAFHRHDMAVYVSKGADQFPEMVNGKYGIFKKQYFKDAKLNKEFIIGTCIDISRFYKNGLLHL